LTAAKTPQTAQYAPKTPKQTAKNAVLLSKKTAKISFTIEGPCRQSPAASVLL
jgi:hypothetical protein